MKRSLINKKELAVIVLVLLVCFGIFIYYKSSDKPRIAKIIVSGKVFKEINLSTNKDEYIIDISSKGKCAHILVKGDAVGFINHECPDGICENVGMIKTALQTAVCMPLEVSVVIEERRGKVDAVSG